MYETYYNLRAEPFRLSPDHRFCYVHKGYAKARAYMAYAFMRAEGFVMVTGRPGTGKTTLIGDLIESLAKDNVTTANLVCTQLQADDLLKTVAYSFGVGSSDGDKAELLQQLNALFHRWHRDGRRALLIVDEAQDLSATAMEELRLLTNIQVDGQPLLQIFLLGQPELRDLILSPPMEQVHQRIVAASHLEALECLETEEYVRHRLEAVGWRGDPAISKSIYPLIYKFSEGVPRRINLICSRLLLHGSVEQRHQIGIEDMRTIIGELQGENLAAGTKFAELDFDVEDEFEQIPIPAESPELQVTEEVGAREEVQLHAVVNESFTEPVAESPRVVPAQQEMDVPVVVEVPSARPVGSLEGKVSSFPADSGSEEEEESASFEPDSAAEAQDGKPDELHPPHGGWNQAEQPPLSQDEILPPGAPDGEFGGQESSVKRSSPVTVFVMTLVILSLAAGYFFAKGGNLNDLHVKTRILWSDFREALLGRVGEADQGFIEYYNREEQVRKGRNEVVVLPLPLPLPHSGVIGQVEPDSLLERQVRESNVDIAGSQNRVLLLYPGV